MGECDADSAGSRLAVSSDLACAAKDGAELTRAADSPYLGCAAWLPAAATSGARSAFERSLDARSCLTIWAWPSPPLSGLLTAALVAALLACRVKGRFTGEAEDGLSEAGLS